MIEGERIRLRPLQDTDWSLIESWGQQRAILWGDYQRFQLDHLPLLRQAYQKTGLLSRESAFLLIETQEGAVIGFVRYTLMPFPDEDFPHPEIGFSITDTAVRGQGYAREAVELLVAYLFAGYSAMRITAVTDAENVPAQRVLTRTGFLHEGTLRQSTFRDGSWRDLQIYGLLRQNHSST
ncbi:MAG: GNAT family N-acetyltransferase [Ardenticatenaceae bacterium]|nr:GNAT family N-acetyltransferase [Anaerolineales bacterium]MCB8921253.1 GNAT family N-acetyltransferase [Ardenticatenaceae bacterium]MCB8990619.1 GNAT family N-acetyltransferase [Ardenticatenaceae bacterium]MCB9004326.1 GNAT family N-acetyltransferase [Ardenticatenaceae bacterium]